MMLNESASKTLVARVKFARLTQRMRLLLPALIGCSIWLTGCVSSRQLVYFQGSSTLDDSVQVASPYVPTIRPGDVLSVQVSSINPEKSAIFNPYALASASNAVSGGTMASPSLPAPVGYVVSSAGAITIPLVGPVKVAGLSTEQASNEITERLKRYVREPTVDVRNQNFRISVLGEVSRPSLFTIPNNQITIVEALGMAGDVTIAGRRENVLVIREVNGVKKFARVDLTRRDLFRSPYYYLRPNDIVYVEPGKARIANADRAYQIAPFVLSAVSAVAIILTRF